MSHYADYLVERLGKLVLEVEDGFAVYYYLDWQDVPAVYIEELYVAPNARGHHVARDMANTIADKARDKDVSLMLGSVNPAARGATASVKVLLAYGMQLDSLDGGLIMFSKSLED